MREHELRLGIAIQHLADGYVFGEALGFPEVSRFGDDPAALADSIAQHAGALIELDAPLTLHRRHLPVDAAEVRDVTVEVAPHTRTPAWTEPVRLTVHAVVYAHEPGGPRVGFVPALRAAVVVRPSQDLDQALEAEILRTLRRTGATRSLAALVSLARVEGVEVEARDGFALARTSIELDDSLTSPDDDPAEEVLAECCDLLADQLLEPAYEVADQVLELAEALAGGRTQGVLLVGPPQVGKTSLVREMCRRRAVLGLIDRPLYQTSGARLLAGQTGLGMWQERCGKLARAARRAGAILHVGSLRELQEVGRSEHNAQSIASFLRPLIARGELSVIAECTAEELATIERTDPQLVAAFRVLHIREPEPTRGLAILEQVAAGLARASSFTWDPEPDADDEPASSSPTPPTSSTAPSSLSSPTSLSSPSSLSSPTSPTSPISPSSPSSLDAPSSLSSPPPQPSSAPPPLFTPIAVALIARLHRRYATYSAFPGRPVRFLRDLARVTAARPIEPAHVVDAFARETGLPRFLLDEDLALDLAAAEAFLATRVHGQPRAVRRVVDALALAKAGLARPRQPIASLWFAGPTGVGKTELARALAAYLFGDPARLTRFDMSEVQDPYAVERLVESSSARHAALAGRAEGLLTAKVRAQPFQVLLFDEVEKAHPLFFDLLLQILGEGRLTDASGRTADFANAVVVMTSNLGVDSWRPEGFGFQGAHAQDAAERHFVEAARAFLRPELFARLGSVVGFDPLPEAVIRAIAARELALVAERDGLSRRGVRLAIEPGVAERLAALGYDPRYGARPLKRAIERALLAPLADQLGRFDPGEPLVAEVAVATDASITVRVQRDPTRPTANRGGQGEVRLTELACECRRRLRALPLAEAWLELSNEAARARSAPPRHSADARATARPAWDTSTSPPTSSAFRDDTRGGAPSWGRQAGVAHAFARLEAERRSLCERAEAIESALLGARCRAAIGLSSDSAPPPDAASDHAALREELDLIEASLDDLVLDVLCELADEPDRVVIAIYSDDKPFLHDLALAYLDFARSLGAAIRAFEVVPSPLRDSGAATAPARRRSGDAGQAPSDLAATLRAAAETSRRPAQSQAGQDHSDPIAAPFWAVSCAPAFLAPRADRPSPLGLGLEISSRGAFIRLAGEAGLHRFRAADRDDERVAIVETSSALLERYRPPDGIDRRGALLDRPRARLYDTRRRCIDDAAIPGYLSFLHGLSQGLAYAIAERTRRTLTAIVRSSSFPF